MGKTVISITAIGTRGDAAGKDFIAKRDSRGLYVLNFKRSSTFCSPTNHAENKVYVESLDLAAALLETEDYLINLVSDNGKRALRQYSKVEIKLADA